MKKSKIVLLILSLIFVLGYGVRAEDTANDYAEMNVLQENGILSGDEDGNLRAEDEITRAEFAAILCRAIGTENVAVTNEELEEMPFEDVPPTHWAAKYIYIAYHYGAINGYGDGNFYPDITVTNEQVIKILISAWGYGNEAEKLGGYPNGYMEIAKQFGITDRILFNYGNASKRWVVSVFTYGALLTPPNEGSDIKITTVNKPVTISKQKDENRGYIQDPISVLKLLAPENLRYERTEYRQHVPKKEFVPLQIQGSKLYFTEALNNRKVIFSVSSSELRKELLYGDFTENQEIDLSTLPVGTWEWALGIHDGSVYDQFSSVITRSEDNIFSFADGILRDTNLKYQPVITDNTNNVALSNGSENTSLPFSVKAIKVTPDNIQLRIDYPDYLKIGYSFDCDFVDDTSADTIFNKSIDGENKKMEPIIIEHLAVNTKYILTTGLSYNTDGSRSVIKGELQITETNGQIDYVFTGVSSELVVKGYEIITDE